MVANKSVTLAPGSFGPDVLSATAMFTRTTACTTRLRSDASRLTYSRCTVQLGLLIS